MLLRYREKNPKICASSIGTVSFTNILTQANHSGMKIDFFLAVNKEKGVELNTPV